MLFILLFLTKFIVMRLLVILLFLTVFQVSTGQIIEFADPNFKAKLLEADETNFIAKNLENQSIKVDLNENGEIEIEEALNVYFLNVSASNISSVNEIAFFNNLRNLDCSSNQISSITFLKDFESDYILNCSNNEISSMQLSGKLRLDCKNNQLTTLDLTNTEIYEELNIENNSLTNLSLSLNYEFVGSLYAKGNNLSALTVGASYFQDFDVQDNPISDLDLDNLLYCVNFLVDSPLLTVLEFNENSFVDYMTINSPLSYLKLPSWNPISLKLTNVDLEQLSYKSDVEPLALYLEDSTILNLQLAGTLTTFSAINTSLVEIDFSEITQNEEVVESSFPLVLNLSNNPFLQSINLKNNKTDFLSDFDFTWTIINNPNLVYICVDEEELEPILELLQDNNSININSLCSYTPGAFYDITASTTLDSNLNGCEDSDTGFPWVEFQISTANNSGTIYTNNTGNFSIPVQAGTYNINPNLPNPDYFSVTPPTATVTFPGTDYTVHTDFCVTPVGEHHDLEVTLIPINVAIPGFDAYYKIVLKNNGNQIESGTLALTYPDSLIDLISTNPSSTSQTTNALNWEFSNLAPLASRSYDIIFNLNSPLDTPPLVMNDVLYFNVTANLEQDETPENNTAILNQTVVDAFDPNDKTCLEGEIINPAMIGKYIHYKIRFENLGTYFAQNVIVEDFIDTTKFDLSTLEPITASHNFFTRVTGNKVEFVFNNIMLPFDDANNDGYVVFKIKTKADLVLGDTVSNTAGIYFNYNPPVITNTASSTFTTLSVSNPQELEAISLYPNPTSNTLSLKADSLQIDTVSIFNMLGQEVLKVSGNNLREINTSALTAGSYILSAKAASQTVNLKFVKQ